jgi:hypothetical protein
MASKYDAREFQAAVWACCVEAQHTTDQENDNESEER